MAKSMAILTVKRQVFGSHHHRCACASSLTCVCASWDKWHTQPWSSTHKDSPPHWWGHASEMKLEGKKTLSAQSAQNPDSIASDSGHQLCNRLLTVYMWIASRMVTLTLDICNGFSQLLLCRSCGEILAHGVHCPLTQETERVLLTWHSITYTVQNHK